MLARAPALIRIWPGGPPVAYARAPARPYMNLGWRSRGPSVGICPPVRPHMNLVWRSTYSTFTPPLRCDLVWRWRRRTAFYAREFRISFGFFSVTEQKFGRITSIWWIQIPILMYSCVVAQRIVQFSSVQSRFGFSPVVRLIFLSHWTLFTFLLINRDNCIYIFFFNSHSKPSRFFCRSQNVEVLGKADINKL